MNTKKGLLFDLDGTLIDSKKSVVDAVYYTAQKYAPGHFSYQAIESRFGESWNEYIKQLQVDNEREVYEDYMRYLIMHHDETVAIFPGVKEGLLELKKDGLKLAIVTNKERILTEHGLRAFGLDTLFDAVVTVDDVTKGKPDPEPINRAMEELQLKKEEALMIGDTTYDVLAAQRAGIDVAVVDWHQTYCSRLTPTYCFHSMKEIVRAVLREEVTNG